MGNPLVKRMALQFPLSILHSWKLCTNSPLAERVLFQSGMISALNSLFLEAMCEISAHWTHAPCVGNDFRS